MPADAAYVPLLPEHPELREMALALEAAGAMFEVLDERFRCVFFSTELAGFTGMSVDEARRQYGRSVIVRTLTEDASILRVTKESGTAWLQHNAPILRRYLDPDDPDFVEVFGPSAHLAAQVEASELAPRAWHDRNAFGPGLRHRRSLLGDMHQVQWRINDDRGQFIGVVSLYRSTVPENLLLRLGRGDLRLYERMDRVSEPARRPAAILFADLEASGAVSRRLSARGYFELIRDLTDLIDSSVTTRDGIPGKHAGDGGSALFLAADFEGSESVAARAAIEAARAIRDGAENVGPEGVSIMLNIGLHWGATLMVGQVATSGRLEVTALGDQMNEGARIESAAKGGKILASKDLIERLDVSDAKTTGVDPGAIAYTALSDLDGATDKAIRDAGAIAVAAI